MSAIMQSHGHFSTSDSAIVGDHNVVRGHRNVVCGQHNRIVGNENVVYGAHNVCQGEANTVIDKDDPPSQTSRIQAAVIGNVTGSGHAISGGGIASTRRHH